MKSFPAVAGLSAVMALTGAGCGAESPTEPSVEKGPVRVIQPLVDAAKPGETIVIPPGIYHETVRIERTENSNITLKGYGAILDGSELPIPREDIDIFSPTGVGIYVRASGSAPPTGVTIEGFIVENFDLGLWVWGAHNQVRNVEARSNTRGFRSIGIWIGVGATLADSDAHDNGSYGIMTSHTTTVRRARCTNNGINDQNGAGILVTGSNVQVLENDVLGNPWGIYIRNASAVVRGNRVHRNARAGIILAGTSFDNLIEDNDATGNSMRNAPPTFDFDLFDEHPRESALKNVWRNNRGKANF